jgi:hypothetical protein
MSIAASVEQLAPSFTGQLLQPSDPGYDAARRVHNGLIDKRPGTRYVNYLGADEVGDPAAAANGANYSRLRELKAKCDPENFFRGNVNIRPK